jgi:hypothetical protein
MSYPSETQNVSANRISGHLLDENTTLNRRLENVVHSLLMAKFDVFFHIDEKLRIVSDNPKLHHFFAIPRGQQMVGRPLEAFLPNGHDKTRLKWLVNHARQFAVSDQTIRTPPVIRVSMSIETIPTHVDIIILPGISIDSIQNLNELLVCINLVPQTDLVKSTPTSGGRLDRLNNSNSGLLGRLNEISTGISPEGEGVGGTTRAPRHLLLIKSLTRDLQESVSRACCEVSESKPIWINPRMIVHDQVVLQEELVRTLPSESQRPFVDALLVGNCKRASSILSNSFEGNLDIFNHQTLGATVKSSQLISATFRLFLGIAMSTDNPIAAIETLHGLSQWAFRIHTKYTLTKGVLINTHLSLALATAVLKFPSRFSCEPTREWVIQTFASCFSCHKAFKSELDDTLPLLYWVTIMWSGVLRVFSEHSDTYTVLDNLRMDISEYLKKHPMSNSVSQLLLLCLNNASINREDAAMARPKSLRPMDNCEFSLVTKKS